MLPPYPSHLNKNPNLSVFENLSTWFSNPPDWQDGHIEWVVICAVKTWFIWKERCNRVFQNKHQTSVILAGNILRFLSSLTLGSYSDASPTNTSPTTGAQRDFSRTWRPPMINFLKINYDASFVSNDSHAGIGLILSDSTGLCKGARTERCFALNSEEAEGYAALAATRWAQELSLINCDIEGDSKSISEYLIGKKSNLSWRTTSILDDARKIMDSPDINYSPIFVYRTANLVADKLAKEARYLHSDQSWSENFPNMLCDLLSADNSDYLY
ncbi:hypothetical protein BVC80_1669g13 [Macleaya cordata]|uniref:RNase H type-1 domain-containing protein n=1 Tax=Macleaya cordata TaxID=56857 RepID=A0A200RBA9_MACCD|nr:hypothetical protein BVC80_1669g13 [Macleaya cordata]